MSKIYCCQITNKQLQMQDYNTGPFSPSYIVSLSCFPPYDNFYAQCIRHVICFPSDSLHRCPMFRTARAILFNEMPQHNLAVENPRKNQKLM